MLAGAGATLSQDCKLARHRPLNLLKSSAKRLDLELLNVERGRLENIILRLLCFNQLLVIPRVLRR